MEEIKEVELRSRRGKFIYNRTYNPVGLNKVSHFSRRGRAPSRLTDEEIKIFVKENTDSETFCTEGNSEKIHHCRLKFIVTLKIELAYT